MLATGTISYGLYLIHPVAIYAAFATFGLEPKVFSLATAAILSSSLVAAFAVAAISWNFFERPIVIWSRRTNYCLG